MKRTARLIKTLITILSIFYFSSCSKTDSADSGNISAESNSARLKNACDVEEVDNPSLIGPEMDTYIFRKKYDIATNRITQIDIGLYSGGSIYQRVVLNVFYSGNRIFFINNANAADTCIKASLNNFGKPATAVFSETIDFGLPDHDFYYDEDGRLSRIVLDTESNYGFWFHYDSRGNNTVISQDTINGTAGICETFEYDNGHKANQQAYFDYPRGFSEDGFLVFHAMGLLPELNPVNLRTHTKVMWGNYVAYDARLFNHVIGPQKKLLGYNVGTLNSSVSASWTLSWQCQDQNQNEDN
jgi:hypothetical protein